jgi:hypothetical protein
MSELKDLLTNPYLLLVWGIVDLACLVILIRDLTKSNSHLFSLMKWVWIFTVLYSGPFGLAIYYYSGRKQIKRDSLWRRGFRSVAHCYSGCGAGEIVGVFVAAGLLALSNWYIAIITFTLAYVAGFAMTIGPLMQEGEAFKKAFVDAFVSESASITVMEIVAIGVDLWLAQKATMDQTLFWSSLVFSLSMGLIAAYPVNVLLIKFGLKEGMHNPQEVHSH